MESDLNSEPPRSCPVRRRWLAAIAALTLLVPAGPLVPKAEASTREIIRIGIVASEDYGHRRTVWEGIFAAVGELHAPKLQAESRHSASAAASSSMSAR